MIEVDRPTFLGICRMSERLASTSIARLSWVSEWRVKSTMPVQGRARVIGGYGGGDEELTFVHWEWDAMLRRVETGITLIRRTRLWELESRLESGAKPHQHLHQGTPVPAHSAGGSIS